MRTLACTCIFLATLTSPTVFAAEAAATQGSVASRHMSPPHNRAATEQLIKRAHLLLGAPYRPGGASARKGFDCSGLLVYLFKTVGDVSIPRTTRQMLQANDAAVPRSELRKGDAVLFNRNGAGTVGHVGLYIGDGQFIHAPRKGKSVRISTLENPYWKRSLVGVRRWL